MCDLSLDQHLFLGIYPIYPGQIELPWQDPMADPTSICATSRELNINAQKPLHPESSRCRLLLNASGKHTPAYHRR